MGKSADQISQEIDQDRADAGQKIDDLQGQLQGQAGHMQKQVQDTAEHVRGQAQGIMNDAVDQVENFDFHQQVEKRPLVSVGAALIGGFVLGGMMGGGKQQQSSQAQSGQGSSGGSQGGGGGMSSQLRSAAKKSGLEDTIANASAALMGSLTEQLKGSLNSNFPGFSEKLDTAQSKSGSFSEKSQATQKEAQQA